MTKKNKTRKPKPQLLVFSAIFFLLTIVGLFTGPCWWVVVPGAVGMVAFLPEAKKWIGKKKESELDFWIKHREYYIELLDNRMLFRVFVLIAIAGIGSLIVGVLVQGYGILVVVGLVAIFFGVKYGFKQQRSSQEIIERLKEEEEEKKAEEEKVTAFRNIMKGVGEDRLRRIDETLSAFGHLVTDFSQRKMFIAKFNSLITVSDEYLDFEDRVHLIAVRDLINEFEKEDQICPEIPSIALLISQLCAKYLYSFDNPISETVDYQDFLSILEIRRSLGEYYFSRDYNIIQDAEMSGAGGAQYYLLGKIIGTIDEEAGSKYEALIDLLVRDAYGDGQDEVEGLSAIARLDELIGLAPVKKEIRTLANVVQINEFRKKQGLKISKMSYHCVFTGNPGTGKTTVARLVGQIYKELGVLKKGHLVETDRSGLVAEYVGQTAVKTNKIIDSALDGVLFIDEAYTLAPLTDNDFGPEAIAILLKRMEDDRDRLVVILAGYNDEMRNFINTNPGLHSRFNRYIDFPDYSAEELRRIFMGSIAKHEYHLSKDAEESLKAILRTVSESHGRQFGNARYVRNLFEKTLEKQANRLSCMDSVSKADLVEILQEDIEKAAEDNTGENNNDYSAITRLGDLIGLAPVKKEIATLANVIQINKIRKEQGLKVSKMSYHCVFTGNPGTGKTTVARLVAQIYRELGVIKRGHLIETDRSGLVAEYVGQTAVKTNRIIDSALDGVLFIDEAYTLVGGENDFGPEAIATLLKRMEDDRDRLVVILAGYNDEMRNFINTNPGLHSRFNRYIDFPDYSAEELYRIFMKCLEKYEYHMDANAEHTLRSTLKNAVDNRDRHFGNARYVRNLFEKTVECQANRLSSQETVSKEDLMSILSEDIIHARLSCGHIIKEIVPRKP